MSRVVAHWAKIVHSFNIAQMSDTILLLILITLMRQLEKGYEQRSSSL